MTIYQALDGFFEVPCKVSKDICAGLLLIVLVHFIVKIQRILSLNVHRIRVKFLLIGEPPLRLPSPLANTRDKRAL